MSDEFHHVLFIYLLTQYQDMAVALTGITCTQRILNIFLILRIPSFFLNPAFNMFRWMHAASARDNNKLTTNLIGKQLKEVT